eukprot:14047825-Alexandrium_andersonii.AAC.1
MFFSRAFCSAQRQAKFAAKALKLVVSFRIQVSRAEWFRMDVCEATLAVILHKRESCSSGRPFGNTSSTSVF